MNNEFEARKNKKAADIPPSSRLVRRSDIQML